MNDQLAPRLTGNMITAIIFTTASTAGEQRRVSDYARRCAAIAAVGVDAIESPELRQLDALLKPSATGLRL